MDTARREIVAESRVEKGEKKMNERRQTEPIEDDGLWSSP
jgi:hypothetical protein